MKHKTKPAFVIALGLVSVLGFLAIFLNSFGIVDINLYVTSLMFIILGAGLVIEGNVLLMAKMLQNGITSDEVSHILSVVIGLLAMLTGLFQLPYVSIVSPTLDAFQGIISFFAIVIIIVETFFVK